MEQTILNKAEREKINITPFQMKVMMDIAAKIVKLFESCPVFHMTYAHIRITLETVQNMILMIESENGERIPPHE